MSLITGVPLQVEFHKHCELWLYPPDGSLVFLHDARKLHVELEMFGNMGGKLTFVLDAQSPHFSAAIADGRVFVEFRRCGRSEGWFIVQNVGRARTNDGYTEEGAAEFYCAPVCFDLDGARILPDLDTDDFHWTYTGYPDDGIKDCLRKQIIAATSYDDPDGNSRELASWQVAADKSQHGSASETLYGRGEKLLEKIQFWSTAWGFIDFAAYGVWAGGVLSIEFDTYFPRRGADRSRTNVDGNDPVYLNDAGDNILGCRLQQDNFTERNAIYDQSLSLVTRDTDRRTSYGLKEMILGPVNADVLTESMTQALAKNTVKKGVEYTLLQTNAFRYAQDFELGDRISHNNIFFGTAVKHEPIKRVILDYGDEGFEVLALVLGDPEPDLIDRMQGGEPWPWDQPKDVSWADDIQPVAGTNVTGTVREVPYADHQHRHRLLDHDGAGAIPDANGDLQLIEGTNISIEQGPNPEEITISGSGVAGADYAVPTIIYGTTHAEGSAETVMRSDATFQLQFEDDATDVGYPDPDDSNIFGIKGGTGCSTDIAAEPSDHDININTVWVRADLRTGSGGQTGLHPTDMSGGFTEPVLIGAGTTTEGSWVNYDGSYQTKLDVWGLIRTRRSLYSTENSLALWGRDAITGDIIVHVVDERSAVGGGGGAACILNVFDADVPRAQFDTEYNDDNPSFIMGEWNVQDSVGAVDWMVNPHTSKATLNNSLDFEVYSDQGSTKKASITGSDGTIDTVIGYQLGATAPAGHILRGDGTRYIDSDLAGGVTGKVNYAAAVVTIDSNAVVGDGEPGTMWAGMIWVDTS